MTHKIILSIFAVSASASILAAEQKGLGYDDTPLVPGTKWHIHAGLLRIDFPGYSGKQTLEPLSWDEFNEKFEEANLAFLFDNNRGSKFNKFVARQKSKTSRR